MKTNNLNKFLENSFELARESIFLLNYSGDLIFVNSAGCKHLEYTFEEITKMKVWEVDNNVDTEDKFYEALSSIEQSQELEDNSVKSFHKTKTGNIIPVSIMTKVIEMNNEKFLISYVNNISERIEQDEKVKLYFELIKESNDFIFLVDFNNEKIEFANEKVCSELGYSLNELKKMRISDIRKPLNDEIYIPEVFEKLMENKTLSTLGKYKKKNEEYIYVETSLSIKNYKNNDYIIAISRDIGERIELERKKEELNIQLEKYNSKLKEEVSSIKEELIEYEEIMSRQSKMAAIGEMLENISHQWRQPLSVISVISTGTKLKNEMDDLEKEELSNSLDMINNTSQSLSKTIDKFRSFSNPNNTKSTFMIKDIIKYTLTLTKNKFDLDTIRIIEKIDDFELYNLKNELIQVLINILNNAIDALLDSKIDNKLIFIDTYEKKNFFSIVIKDNAGGIPSNILKRIFEPYFTTKHKSQGTGIGLYMSDTIIHKHLKGRIIVSNKEITFENKDYVGAEFEIQLPKTLNN